MISPQCISAFIKALADETFTPFLKNRDGVGTRRKAGGEIVTRLDGEMEHEITVFLKGLYPAARIVGEETADALAERGEGLREEDIWLVDPLDGTGNFASGGDDFAVMLCRLLKGEPVLSLLYFPATHQMAVAEKGSGAFLDGERLTSAAAPLPPLGEIHDGHAPLDLKPGLAAARRRLPSCRPRFCAGITYLGLATGERQFAFYYRTRPWDHAPGALLLREAGGRVARLGGEPYRPDDGGAGLIATARAEDWERVRAELLG
jgi:fructose-1,6-bisphosphatase/inositol monophosphatase family enzyme